MARQTLAGQEHRMGHDLRTGAALGVWPFSLVTTRKLSVASSSYVQGGDGDGSPAAKLTGAVAPAGAPGRRRVATATAGRSTPG